MQHRNCEQCGTTYDVPTHGQHARYCSRDCRNEAYNERRRAASKKPDRDCATLTLSRWCVRLHLSERPPGGGLSCLCCPRWCALPTDRCRQSESQGPGHEQVRQAQAER